MSKTEQRLARLARLVERGWIRRQQTRPQVPLSVLVQRMVDRAREGSSAK